MVHGALVDHAGEHSLCSPIVPSSPMTRSGQREAVGDTQLLVRARISHAEILARDKRSDSGWSGVMSGPDDEEVRDDPGVRDPVFNVDR